MHSDELIETIRSSVIGRDEVVDGPFGPRKVTYADYTASGRSLSFIEDYIREAVMPLYANTHTESSGTGLQTTRFREEAREMVRSCVGATDDHAVLFCGSGMTGAIDRLIGVLGIRIPCNLDDRYDLSSSIPVNERPVVFSIDDDIDFSVRTRVNKALFTDQFVWIIAVNTNCYFFPISSNTKMKFFL